MKNCIFIFIILLSGCIRKGPAVTSDISIDTVDFASLDKINELPSSIIKNKQYINITIDNEESLFSTINQIEIKDNRIYIRDFHTKIFAVFDSLGKSIGRIGAVGRAPGEYLNATYFTLGDSGSIHLFDGRQDKLNTYDKNLQFISSKKIPFEIDILYYLKDKIFLLGVSSWNKEENTKAKILLGNSDFQIQKVYSQYDEYIDNNVWFGDYYFMKTENGIFYNRPLDNIVYQFSSDGELMKGYYFDFGKKEIPPYAKKNYEKYKDLYNNTYALTGFTVINDKYIIGRIIDNGIRKNFLINRSKNTLYLEGYFSFATLGKIIGCDGNKIITCLTPGEYANLEDDMYLPDEVRAHLENQGFTICLYELN